MPHTLQVKTTILPGHRIEISSPELPEGRSATVLVTLDEPRPTLATHANPDLAEAERLYLRDLPQLLLNKAGRWVAYTAQGCIAEGADELALFRYCSEQGLARGHYLITRVEPDLPPAEITENWLPPDV
jgi:hypothetical protein